MKTYIIRSLKITGITLLLFGVIYPLFISAVAWLIAPNKGRGEEIKVNGNVVGFELIGQKFDDDRYFNSRPSAVEYNAASTGGSNKGPSNPDYLALVQARIDTFMVHNPSVRKEEIPSDLVTASGSGLDPHISVAAARVQVDRIAKARNISADVLAQLIERHTEKTRIGFLGISRIHVLRLNIALDELKKDN